MPFAMAQSTNAPNPIPAVSNPTSRFFSLRRPTASPPSVTTLAPTSAPFPMLESGGLLLKAAPTMPRAAPAAAPSATYVSASVVFDMLRSLPQTSPSG